MKSASDDSRLSAGGIVFAILAAALVVGGLAWFAGFAETPDNGIQDAATAAPEIARTSSADALPEIAGLSDADVAALAETLRARLRQTNARADEAVLVFRDAASRDAFLARAAEAGFSAGEVLDEPPALRARVTDYAAFARELASRSRDISAVGANPVMSVPTPPVVEERAARRGVAVGDALAASLGLLSIDSSWGSGVVIAVLDGGATADAGLGARLRYLDIGYGVSGPGSDGAHGTAVAALAAGPLGVAPSAQVLSVRVTSVDGMSDAFAVARGIHAALDAGARVINVSLGGYGTSPVLGVAVERALAEGAAIVASSGNDQVARLVWPAAYAGVVSVGATDADGIQAIFSNSGEGLQLTAPGYGVATAGPGGTRVMFSGTSASAPVAAGAIAALMSTTPGLSPQAAADALATHGNDGGAAGADADYGRATINLGWAMDRGSTTRRDVAISSVRLAADRGGLEFTLQNRGAVAAIGAILALTIDGANSRAAVPDLAPGESLAFFVSVARPASGMVSRVDARLAMPSGWDDVTPDNNRRAGTVTWP